MNFYHQYDKNSGKFLGSWKCQIDPIEKKSLYPAHSTPIAPPKHDKYQWPYWESGKWTLKDSSFETKRKLSLTDENGVRLYKENGEFAIAKTEEEIKLLTEKKRVYELKKAAVEAKSKLISMIYDELILKAMSAKQLDYVKKLDAIINGEKLINIELPTLD